jgi:hypothetical protein
MVPIDATRFRRGPACGRRPRFRDDDRRPRLIRSRDRCTVRELIAPAVELRETLVLRELEELSYKGNRGGDAHADRHRHVALWRARQLLVRAAGA